MMVGISTRKSPIVTRAAFLSVLKGNLILRLSIMIMAAIMPAIFILLYIQIQICSEQTDHLGKDASAKTEFINGDLQSIVQSAREVTLILSKKVRIRAFDPTCQSKVDVLKPFLDHYQLIKVTYENGEILCSSGSGTKFTQLYQREQNAAILSKGVFETGLFQPGNATAEPMLMFNQPFVGVNGQRGVISVGLSLAWLKSHFESFQLPQNSFIKIADREGTALVVIPEIPNQVGKPLPAGFIKAMGETRPGIMMLNRDQGDDHIVGYIPSGSPSSGLFSSVGLSLRELLEPIRHVEQRAYGLMACGAFISIIMVLLIGQQLVYRPRKSLMAAAKAWTDGNLDARVDIFAHATSDFVAIANAFNDMAENLDRQRVEGNFLSSKLEVQVAARTADLIDSRDRLQVSLAEQAKVEASLRQAHKMQAVGQLAGGIAHDFNNLLTAVISALEMLRNRMAVEDHRSLRLLDTALLAADRGAKLTSQLLGFSRRQRLLPVNTDLNRVIEGMMGLLASTLGVSIKVETDLDSTLWSALVDPHQIESAILNLALNARDASTAGGKISIATRNTCLPADAVSKGQKPTDDLLDDRLVVSDPAPAGDYVMIQVIDTGSGMPPDVLAHVFEPFFTTKELGRGSGLGLSQVHGLAAQSGGELRIESCEGIGTSVSLLLPRAAGLAVRPALPCPMTVAAKRRRVLVADDDDNVRRVTGDMLNELGYTVLLAQSGAAALQLLAHEPPIDMLLADYAMPGMTGLALIERVAQKWPSIDAVLVTGHADIDAKDLAGCCRLLQKPFSLAMLANIFAKADAEQDGSMGA